MPRRLRSVLIGLALVVAGVGFWNHLVPSAPWDDWRLSTRGAVAPAVVTDVWDDADFGDDGRLHESYGADYEFTLPDGRRVEGTTGTRSGSLSAGVGDRFEVEYLPDAPEVNRPAMTGGAPLLVRLGAGLFLFALLVGPGIAYLWDAVRGQRPDAGRVRLPSSYVP